MNLNARQGKLSRRSTAYFRYGLVSTFVRLCVTDNFVKHISLIDFKFSMIISETKKLGACWFLIISISIYIMFFEMVISWSIRLYALQ